MSGNCPARSGRSTAAWWPARAARRTKASATGAPAFRERLIKGETWRVYTAEDTAKGVRVAVGDRLGLRAHLVEEIIKGLLAPLLLTIPLLGLFIWASLNRGLRPLQALARELGRRNADDMSPVETGKIPAEIRPVVDRAQPSLPESPRRHAA